MSFRTALRTGIVTAVVAVPMSLGASSALADYSCTNVPTAPGGSAPTGPAVACTTVTETVTGGDLTLTQSNDQLNNGVSGTGVTLGNTDATDSYSLAYATGDNTGTGHGWTESISQSQFTSGANVIGNPDSSVDNTDGTAVTNVSVTNAPGSTNTDPTDALDDTNPGPNSVLLPLTGYASTSATSATGDSPSTVFEVADAGTGMGNFNVSPTVTFNVPANTYAGSYNAIAEVDLISGPTS